MERADLASWIRSLGCVEEHNGWFFLRDPNWSAEEKAAAEAQMRQADQLSRPERGWLCIRTGGSSGGVKFARHDERTIGAAVRGFSQHFGLTRVNTVGVLPPWHVSGLMARARCFATGGTYIDVDWKRLETGQLPALPVGDCVISLVPTQLQRLLGSGTAVDWLRQFRLVLIGGGPMWPALADAAAQARIPSALSYGMTETAAMVAAQRPAEFAAGDRSSGKPMPHASVRIDEEGRVCISGESLFVGYFPTARSNPEFTTEDLGQLDDEGRLHLQGRRDAVIITGGKKVHPAEVEAVLRASGEFEDVAVIGLPDADWGEVVVAFYPRRAAAPDTARAAAALAPHQRPKRFIPVELWPRTAQGKINRAALAELAAESI